MDTKTSRYSGKIGAILGQQIAEGKLVPGELIPSVRELSRMHRLSASTVARGHRRIAWFGSTAMDGHYLDRLSGYTVACQRAGIAMGLWDGDETQALALLLAKPGASTGSLVAIEGCP